MAISFDGPTKRIIMDRTSVSAAEIWTAWVDWSADNPNWPAALKQIGGDELGSGLFIPPYFFLLNGWRVRPMEASHTFVLTGNLVVEGGGAPVVPTLGNYNVLTQYTVPVQAQGISVSGGSGTLPFTADDVANATIAKLPINDIAAASAAATPIDDIAAASAAATPIAAIASASAAATPIATIATAVAAATPIDAIAEATAELFPDVNVDPVSSQAIADTVVTTLAASNVPNQIATATAALFPDVEVDSAAVAAAVSADIINGTVPTEIAVAVAALINAGATPEQIATAVWNYEV